MTDLHHYALALSWLGNRGDGTARYDGYDRRFRIDIDGKPTLIGSADPHFRGDAALHNPEEWLLAALSGCHMLAYLALCARARVIVVGYGDAAIGTMATDAGGGGRFSEVVLRPRVTVARAQDRERARALHDRAHALCFIANSCAFPVRHESSVAVADDDSPTPATSSTGTSP